MGWFGGWFGQADPSPLSKLDPKVREFLEKESPIKYHKPTATEEAAAPPPPAAKRYTAAVQQQRPQATDATQPAEDGAPVVPRESLFQDGRYAHLWRTYRSQSSVDAETKSDHEKLMDVLEAYKARKAQIGRAALENCALEQESWNACMKGDDWTARLGMCRHEVRKFERCYMMQSRLLKALGYLSTYDRPPDVDEQIQMHADKLYHQMLAQEAEAAAARAEGRPEPSFAPLVQPKEKDDTSADTLPPAQQKSWRERLEKVDEADRPAEEEAMRAELRVKREIARQLEELETERKARRQQGAPTIGDRVAGFFGK